MANLGRITPRDREVMFKSINVIASVAKQSILSFPRTMDCFVANAPLRKRFAFVAGNDV
jgi:hypothetical protein